MIELTLEGVRNMAREVVEEVGPDYTYKNAHPQWLSPDEVRGMNYEVPDDAVTGCRYVVGGDPACIVGVILHRLGVPLHALERVNTAGVTRAMWSLAKDGIIHTPHGGVDGTVMQYLCDMQGVQDFGKTWAEAHKTAEGRLS